MRVMLSQDAGFGDQVVTTSPIESANAVIKRWNNFQPKDAATFLEDMLACVQEQVNNVQKAFLNLPSKYNVREEFQDKVIRSYNLLDTAAKKKALDSIKDIKIDSKRYNEVKSYKPVGLATSLDASFDKSEANDVEISADDPFNCLLPSFTRSDIDLLKRKAEEIMERKQIIAGFSDLHFIVKSATGKYRTVKLLSTGKYSCDHDCLGYESRKICTHTIAAALYGNNLHKYLETFRKESTINLTKLTIPSSVNQKAGKKSGKQLKRKHNRSVSPVSIIQSTTLGELFSELIATRSGVNEELNRTPTVVSLVLHTRDSGMKMRIQIPKRPKYVETTTTPFALIAIKGNTRKCAGCGGKLKDGPDPLLVHDLDKSICIGHKEKDYFFNKEHNFWKPTYGNHHYHIFPDCLTNKNPSFVQSNLVIRLALDGELKKFLYNRFH